MREGIRWRRRMGGFISPFFQKVKNKGNAIEGLGRGKGFRKISISLPHAKKAMNK